MDRGSARPAACRRLFADEPLEAAADSTEPVALEQTAQARRDNDANGMRERLFQEHRDAARLKWNFDFETETPLEGDWEWERVAAPQPERQQQACAPRVQVQQQESTRDPGNKSL